LTVTIDRFPDGDATSFKSIDLRSATYQNPALLVNRINTYVNKLVNYKGWTWGTIDIQESQIMGRTLKLIVPKGAMTSTQRAAIEAAGSRAEGIGVKFEVIHH
jgi:hypothetical protein